MSRQVSRDSIAEYQTDERAEVARLGGAYQADERAGVAALLASIRQMSRQVSRGSAVEYQEDDPLLEGGKLHSKKVHQENQIFNKDRKSYMCINGIYTNNCERSI